MRLHRHALALALIAVALPAGAAKLDGTFTLPTQYEDGSALPAANIKHIRVEVGTCTSGGAFGVKEGEVLVAPPATTWSATVPRAFGDFCARAQTETLLGNLSAFTAAVKVTKTEPKPNPPLLTVATIAYQLQRAQGNKLAFVPVGTVPLGVECADPLVDAFTQYKGPVVASSAMRKDGVIAARCGRI